MPKPKNKNNISQTGSYFTTFYCHKVETLKHVFDLVEHIVETQDGVETHL